MPDIKDLLEGKFARVGFSLVSGAIITFIEEGKREENTLDSDDNADERLTVRVEINGEKKLITPNLTSMRELAMAWGTHTKSWVGKKAKVTVESKLVFGERKQVAFYHPVVGMAKASPEQKAPELKPEQEKKISERLKGLTGRNLRLEQFKMAHETLGDVDFYDILSMWGYKTAEEIKEIARMDGVLQTLRVAVEEKWAIEGKTKETI